MRNIVEEIKAKLSISSVVSSYIELQRVGSRFRARCPFHSEKTPSFYVSDQLGIYKCFGCGESGDLISFVQKYENIDFKDALKKCCDMAGIEYQEGESKAPPKRPILQILNYTQSVYSQIFQKNQKVRRYLKSRHFTDETIDFFKLGLVDNNSRYVTSNLIKKKGFKDSELRESGIFNQDLSDLLFGRLVVPIKDINGQVVSFTGRVVEGYTPENIVERSGKYINGKESQVFKKSHILFNLDNAKNYIKEQGFAVLCEGQMDVIKAWQSGLKNIVCASGTSITAEQVKILSRYTDNVYLAMDNDSAGKLSVRRFFSVARGLDLNYFVLSFKEGIKDMDEFFDSGGSVEELMQSKIDIVNSIIEDIKNQQSSGLEKQRQISFLVKELQKASEFIKTQAEKTFPEMTGKIIGSVDKNDYSNRISSVDGAFLYTKFLAMHKVLHNRRVSPKLLTLFDDLIATINYTPAEETLRKEVEHICMLFDDNDGMVEILRKCNLKKYLKDLQFLFKDNSQDDALIKINRIFRFLEEALKSKK